MSIQNVQTPVIVRYADDAVLGFQHRYEAERFLAQLRERLAKFGLELNSEKTRLIEFGRFATLNRKRRGQGRPETFNFLGFIHMCVLAIIRKRIFLDVVRLALGDLLELEAKVVEVAVG